MRRLSKEESQATLEDLFPKYSEPNTLELARLYSKLEQENPAILQALKDVSDRSGSPYMCLGVALMAIELFKASQADVPTERQNAA